MSRDPVVIKMIKQPSECQTEICNEFDNGKKVPIKAMDEIQNFGASNSRYSPY